MFQAIGPTIPFELCPASPFTPGGHCFHGVFAGGPITSIGRCCWCGGTRNLPWSMQPEQQHGIHHPVRASDRATSNV